MGAYGLTVAAAFAVALAVLLSVSTTQTAEAAVTTGGDPLPATGVDGGTKVYTTAVSGQLATFVINQDDSTAMGKFTHGTAVNSGQRVTCNDQADCDKDSNPNSIQVEVQVDADSPNGNIIIAVTTISGSASATTADFVRVKQAPVPTTLTVKPVAKTIAAAEGTTTVNIKLTDENDAGIADTAVSIITTGGSLSVIGDADGADCTAAQVCASQTKASDNDDENGDETGTIVATLAGINRAGLATITVIAGDLTATAEVVLFGPVDRIEASPEQGSIEIGGSTFVVVTAYDSGNNPVSGVVVDVATKSNGSQDITGPAAKTVPVSGDNDVDKDANGNHAVDKGDIRACGDDAVVGDDSATENVVEGSLGTANSGTSVARGTNLDGQCVIEISAPKKDVNDAAADAARGTHSVVINALSGTATDALDTYTRNSDVDKVTVELQVGGPPSSVTSDASEYVDPLSSTKITYTVWDDEDVRVGEVDVVIDQIEGDGKITAGEGTGRTKDGQGSFTFRAPLNEGTAVFLVTVNPGTSGEIQQPISVVVGEAMPEEPDMPAMPDGDALSFLSPSIASFSGGSVADLAAAAEAECPGGATYWVQASDGSWPAAYSTTVTVAIANSPFEAAWADGFGMTAVFFSECEMDAMGDEG